MNGEALTRQAIADALNGVAGVTATAYRPLSIAPGIAWPRWSGDERAVGDSYVTTWQVFVILPNDDRAASQWRDENVADLVDALTPVLFVDGVEPASIPADQGSSGSALALIITGRE